MAQVQMIAPSEGQHAVGAGTTPLEAVQDIYALSDQEALRYVNELMPNCADCGCELKYEPMDPIDTPQNWLAMLAVVKEKSPHIYENWRKLQAVCDVCTHDRSERNREQRRKNAVTRLKHETYGHLMPDIAGIHTFAHSDKAAEERHPEMWAAAKDWFNRDTNVWICGDSGSGKTFLARCMLNLMLDRMRPAAELSGPTLCSIAGKFSWEQQIEPYVKVTILLLDDLDKGNWDGRAYNALLELLNRRLDYGKRLIVTANTTGKRWAEHVATAYPENPSMGSAITNRMAPMRDMKRMLRWEMHGKAEVK